MNGKHDKGKNETITEIPDDLLTEVKGGALGRGPRGKQGKRKVGDSASTALTGAHKLTPHKRVEFKPGD